jgi:hypothetical protein
VHSGSAKKDQRRENKKEKEGEEDARAREKLSSLERHI